ncbi:hypothetical protein [Kutzneria kofuensis]|uniref:Uncharacterized protein n=1 Tax=Kutzneria kofuensis TaxID=103725 RepID=A0A7W9KCC0_9PSEU|nr:hypothetical protein [Kutzneria kofuensis]MBB5889916.1 hypothetical protein [Kutzneria kofuensis]
MALLDRVLDDQRRTRNAVRLLAIAGVAAGVMLAVVVTVLVFVIDLVPSPASAGTTMIGGGASRRVGVGQSRGDYTAGVKSAPGDEAGV